MNLALNVWYVRWFFWSLGILYQFKDVYSVPWKIEDTQKRGTNLCMFVQSMLIWAPLVIILHLVLYGSALAALTAIPIYFFGFWGYAWGVGSIGGVIAVIVAALWCLKWSIEQREKRRAAANTQKKEEKPSSKKAPSAPSFFTIFWRWIVAKKQKFCLLIAFTKPTKEQT